MCHPEGEIFSEKLLHSKQPVLCDQYLVTFTAPYNSTSQRLLTKIRDKGFIKVDKYLPDFPYVNLLLGELPLKIARKGYMRRTFVVESPLSEEASKFVIQSCFKEVLEKEDFGFSFEIKKIDSVAV